MGHHHHHDHSHHQQGQKNIAIALFLNLGFTLIEIVGGILTNSVAIQSDALHDAGDTFSLGLAWYFQKLSKKGRTPSFTFGYKRFNTLGAMITGTVLAAGSVYILMESVPRLFRPESVDAQGMIGLAILGVIVNGLAVFRLRKGGGKSLNEEMISWHLIEDILGWVAVLIGSILMYFFDLPWIDPALSIIITLYILYNVFRNLWKAVKVMLQATPDNFNVDHIKEKIEGIEGVDRAHHIHVWSLDGEYHLLSAHVITCATMTLDEVRPIRKEIMHMLEHDLNIDHSTLQFEVEGECAEPEKV